MSHSQRSKRSSNATGLTLIEVVAALAILALILGGVITAHTRTSRCWRLANERLDAVAALDQLLEGWLAEPQASPPRPEDASIPIGRSGHLTASLTWRTYTRSNVNDHQLPIQTVRVEAVRTTPAGEERVVAYVDLVVLTDDDVESQPPTRGGTTGPTE